MALDLVRCLIGDPRKEICGNFHSGALKDQDYLSQDRPLPCGAVEKASSKEALSAVVESLLLDHFCNEGSTVGLLACSCSCQKSSGWRFRLCTIGGYQEQEILFP